MKPTLTSDQPRNATGWVRVAIYAPQPGELSREMFLAACEAGEIPVSVRRYGPRGLFYLNAAEFYAWRYPAAALTAPGDAARANENLFE